MDGRFIIPISRMPSISELHEITRKSPESTGDVEVPFEDVFREMFGNLTEQQEISSNDSLDLFLGQTDDLHNIMINSEIAGLTLELTVQLTSRALNAYNEIMRMQV